MIVRSGRMADAEGIAAAHRASIKVLCSECYTPRDIAGWMGILAPAIYENAITEKIMIVAEDEGGIQGLGILDPERREIGAIYVHPRVKGTGVGRRLLLGLEDRASKAHIHRLTLCSTLNALGFYRHHGYIREGKAYHELPNGVALECIRMYKTLSK